jgi:hypothetical protein
VAIAHALPATLRPSMSSLLTLPCLSPSFLIASLPVRLPLLPSLRITASSRVFPPHHFLRLPS